MKRRRRLQHPGRESRHKRLAPELLLSSLSLYDRKGGLRLVRLWREWERVVGPEVAELARPMGHKEGTLLLAAADSIAAQQLSYYVPELLARVNGFFGEEVFDKVRFELLDGRAPLDGQPEPEPPPAPARAPEPLELGGLVDKVDPDTAIGRCYLAFVHARERAKDANTRPTGASRRRK